MGIQMKLLAVQQALKAPKDQFNDFGKYKYRSCETILESLKPHLQLNQMTIMFSDVVKEVGGRNYVETTATLCDVETGETISVTATAREEESKKGMDGSQITGASSSYARKYALNGLFAIDDNKDSDETNNGAGDAVKPQGGNYTPKRTNTQETPKNEPETAINAPDGIYYCDLCYQPIIQRKNKGKIYTAKEIAEISMRTYGRQVCWDCMAKLKDEGKAD